MSGGMCASIAQPCEGLNINRNGGDKLFRKWSLVQSTYSFMIQYQHQYKIHQDVYIDIAGGDKLFAQWSVVKINDFLMNYPNICL